MIDVIIPAYNAHQTLRDTLDTVVFQTIVKDLKVYIVNDASAEDYHEIIEEYKDKLNISEIDLPENSGPGVARQYGLDRTNSRFVFFLDSDDLLYESTSLQKLKEAIEGYDMSKGGILEETIDGVKEDHVDELSLHGKLYRRSIIRKNDLKFKYIWF